MPPATAKAATLPSSARPHNLMPRQRRFDEVQHRAGHPLSISYGALGKYPAAGKAGSTLILVIGLFDGGTFTADPDPTHRKEQPCWT
jgi:hypothetical protein